ncbi:hypothetical protein MNBD_GAMMA12-14 [hydrothermal vent metagenome]|uniref:DUF5666 domain-containing protein n=1 Tax=hydrothermal vent metagenome TaxID=652676 RepID=A0A3B0Y4C5_9ZZZZ
MWYRLIALVVLLSNTSCTFMEPVTLAKSVNEDDGVGGTGHTHKPDIYFSGHISAFGSIFVNQARIHYNASTILKVDGSTSSAYKLTLGDNVDVLAYSRTSIKGSYIHVIHEVAGVVTQRDKKSNTFTILKQTIKLSDKNMPLPKIGQWLKVSGYTDNNFLIHATNLKHQAHHQYLLSGYPHSKQGQTYIRNIRIINQAAIPNNSNDYMIVTGHFAKNNFVIKQVRSIKNIKHHQSIKKFFIRGYIRKMIDDTFTLGRLGLTVPKQYAQQQLGKLLTIKASRISREKFDISIYKYHSKNEHSPSGNINNGEVPTINREAPEISREAPEIDRSAIEERGDGRFRP